jgi:cardiolipin synthase
VQVALIYDAVGSIATPEAFFRYLADGGVATCAFNPIKPTQQRPGYWNIVHRDHRKLLVVDDEVAFTGGINISRVYGSGSFSRSRGSGTDALDDGWRDTQIEIRGPAAPAMSRLFAQTWREQGCHAARGNLLSAAAVPPSKGVARRAGEPGERVVKLLASDPRDGTNRIYTVLLGAVEASRRSVRVTMGYFAPGPDFVDALCDAARRGVQVELVLPGRSDFTLILHAGRSYYARMLEAGVKLYEMEHATMHAKTAVIDGVFSTVGSSNMDWRSFVANHEVNAIVLGRDFGEHLEAVFRVDLAHAQAIDSAAWRQRGWGQRVMEWVGRLSERLL